jgi:hypothetical protein
VSLLVVPGIDGRHDIPAVFDSVSPSRNTAVPLRLKSVEQRGRPEATHRTGEPNTRGVLPFSYAVTWMAWSRKVRSAGVTASSSQTAAVSIIGDLPNANRSPSLLGGSIPSPCKC